MHPPHNTSSKVETPVPSDVAETAEQELAPRGNSTGEYPTAAPGAIRAGSPFRPGSAQRPKSLGDAGMRPAFDPRHDGAASFELGITSSTAFGGMLAAYAILPFAAASAIAFPVGAIMISGLGLVLAVFAFAAQRPALTAIAMFLHLLLGMFGYFQML